MEATAEWAAGIAHEFNNLLGTILGYVELAQMDLDQGRYHSIGTELAMICAAGNRARDLVGRIEACSRVAAAAPGPLAPDDVSGQAGDERPALCFGSRTTEPHGD